MRCDTWGGEEWADGGAFMPPLIFLFLFANQVAHPAQSGGKKKNEKKQSCFEENIAGGSKKPFDKNQI